VSAADSNQGSQTECASLAPGHMPSLRITLHPVSILHRYRGLSALIALGLPSALHMLPCYCATLPGLHTLWDPSTAHASPKISAKRILEVTPEVRAR
jgi:hypothetical protein